MAPATTRAPWTQLRVVVADNDGRPEPFRSATRCDCAALKLGTYEPSDPRQRAEGRLTPRRPFRLIMRTSTRRAQNGAD